MRMDVDRLVDRVRQEARDRGIDPKQNLERLESLIHDVLADERGVSAPAATLRAVSDQLVGMGALTALMEAPEIEEIWINAPDRIFIARHGVSELTTIVLTPVEVQELIERILTKSGRRLDLSVPFVDAQLDDGSRLHVAIPDVVRHWTVNIRKHSAPVNELGDLVRSGSLTQEAAAFLSSSVAAGLNILISGGTHTGKTTLANCLLASLSGRERVITIEEVFELSIDLPDAVQMQARQPNLEGAGEVTLRQLIKEALRMRPSRLVVGEVRGAEALDLLIAMNSGVPSLCTIHANSARDALLKIATLPLLGGPNVTSDFVVPTVATAVDLIVHCRLDHGMRRIEEIRAIGGQTDGHVISSEPIYQRVNDLLVRTVGQVPALEKFHRAGIEPAAA
jgi:pilus assembly protein CpaF